MVIISLFPSLLATFINYGEARSLTTGVNAELVKQSTHNKDKEIYIFYSEDVKKHDLEYSYKHTFEIALNIHVSEILILN